MQTPCQGGEVEKTKANSISPTPALVLTSPPSQNSLEEERNGWRRASSSPSQGSLHLLAGPRMAICKALLPLLWAHPHHTSWEGDAFC